MSSQQVIQEPVQTDHEATAKSNESGEDIANTIDGSDESNVQSPDTSLKHANSPSVEGGGQGVGGAPESPKTSESIHGSTQPPVISPSSPVSEAKRYRKRAQAAEREVEELKKNLADREKVHAEQEQKIASLEQRQKLDELLHAAGTLDIEAARQLAQAALQQMPNPDGAEALAEAVNDLRRHKPYLFQTAAGSRRTRPASGAMSAREAPGAGSGAGGASATDSRSVAMNHAATDALQTGHRTDLLRYLRLRRKK